MTEHQDRCSWYRDEIDEGGAAGRVGAAPALARAPTSCRRPSPRSTATAATFAETDWPQIAALYGGAAGASSRRPSLP